LSWGVVSGASSYPVLTEANRELRE